MTQELSIIKDRLCVATVLATCLRNLRICLQQSICNMSSSSAFHAPLEHMISSNSWQVFLSCSVFCSSLLVICNYLLHVLLGISPFLLSCDLQRKDFLVTEHIFSMMPFPILSQWCPFQHFLNDALSNTFSIMPFLTPSQLCSFQHFLRDALSNTFSMMPVPTGVFSLSLHLWKCF